MGGYPVRIGAIERGRDRRARGGRVITGEAPPLNEIHAFIKDAYGDPYIPGSSIKGLLRSIYLQHALSQQKPGPGHQQLRVPDRRSAQQQTGIQEEQRLLRRAGRDPSRPKDAVNDLFQAIRVSDSASLSLRSLEVVQKIDMNIHGEAGGLPLFREALSPGTEFVVRVSVDTSPLEHGGWPHGASFVEGIAAAAARVNEHRYAPYSAKYFDDEPIAGARVYLGGGAGYRSKTFVTDQADMARVLDEQFRSIKHKEKTMQLGVSPLVLKVTKAGEGNYEEMGLCELTVKKVKE
jgi:CRISPR-associated protein Csm5